MKKKINLNLLESILETDLLLVEKSSKSNVRALKSTILSNSNFESIYGLEIFEALKNLKQLIRVLQFLNKHDSKNLHICSSNKIVLGFLNNSLSNKDNKKSITIHSSFTKMKSSKAQINSLLLLDEPLPGNNNVFKKLFEENILIINKINSKVELNNNGTYKIYNNVLDSKKLIFFIALLRQLFIKST